MGVWAYGEVRLLFGTALLTRRFSTRCRCFANADTPTRRYVSPAGSHRAAFQPEIALSVLETNSSHQVAKQFFVHRDFATVHFLAKQIAKDPSKIFVSRIRHKT